MSIPLIGFANANHKKQDEKDDLKYLSTKRVKWGETIFSYMPNMPLVYKKLGCEHVDDNRSKWIITYKNMMTRKKMKETEETMEHTYTNAISNVRSEVTRGLKIEEKKLRGMKFINLYSQRWKKERLRSHRNEE